MKTYIMTVQPDGQSQTSELCTQARSVDQAAQNLASWWANMHGKNAGYSLKEIRSVSSIDAL